MAKKEAKAEDEIVIEAAPDTPLTDDADPSAEAAAIGAETPAAIEPEDGIETLKANLAKAKLDIEAEKAGRIEAEARAVRASGDVKDSNLHLVTNAIEMMKQSQGSLKTAYANALAEGDYEAAADSQFKMVENSTKLQTLEAGKQRLEAIPTPEPVADPVEALAQQLSGPAASWVRRHPEFARDPRQYQRMIGAHNLAIGNGMPADSAEYFEAVEKTLGVGGGAAPASASDGDATADAAKPTGGRQSSPPEAPVTRASNGGTRTQVVRLSPQEREMAEFMGMTDEDYARNKLSLQKEGKMH